MVILPTAYLPPISWFIALATSDGAQLQVLEHYQKQTFRNRCRILMPDGPADLIVPVAAAPGHTPIREIQLSDHGRWQHHHWNALRTAYGKSPFFEFYADDFAPFYLSHSHRFLLDFNEELRRLICQLIDLDTPVSLADRYAPPLAEFPSTTRPYYQVFAQRLGFQPGLSIVDLLFNLGPEALLYLLSYRSEGEL